MPLRVKFLSKSSEVDTTEYWGRFLPDQTNQIGEVKFIFNRDCREYDWLVAYDTLPSVGGERFPLWEETLACPRQNTLFITSEPSTIKVYGKAFLSQFGHVLTSQEPWAVQHLGAIFSQPGLVWFYGKTYPEAVAGFPMEKSGIISTVCSTKQQKHTLHSRRHDFTQRLKGELPQLEVFGKGHRPVDYKFEALDPFRYHVAIENHLAPHHWTEKLADAFLAGCLPFYFGCPNVFDYFPEESLIPIDIRDFEGTSRMIFEAIDSGCYEKRLPAIQEARRLILEEYSTFPMLAGLIATLHQPAGRAVGKEQILSRHAWRKQHPIASIGDGIERYVIKSRARRAGKELLSSCRIPEP